MKFVPQICVWYTHVVISLQKLTSFIWDKDFRISVVTGEPYEGLHERWCTIVFHDFDAYWGSGWATVYNEVYLNCCTLVVWRVSQKWTCDVDLWDIKCWCYCQVLCWHSTHFNIDGPLRQIPATLTILAKQFDKTTTINDVALLEYITVNCLNTSVVGNLMVSMYIADHTVCYRWVSINNWNTERSAWKVDHGISHSHYTINMLCWQNSSCIV